ncbi:MAG: hypothetical protein ACFE9S_06525 [Candidatus Hermodarchaeota archaeon]
MGLNSRIIEKRVENFLYKVLLQETPSNKKTLQRKKFILLSKLVADLFDTKNSQICFNNISNLIILVLNIYNEKFPIDIYSLEKENILSKADSKFKHILKEEFLIE